MPAGKYTVATPVVEVEESGKAMKVELFQQLGRAERSSCGRRRFENLRDLDTKEMASARGTTCCGAPWHIHRAHNPAAAVRPAVCMVL